MNEELWEEFHTVVNMTSRELRDWLRTEAADPDDEALPDQAGPPTGQHVLAILNKRKEDIGAADEEAMRAVVDEVSAKRRADLEPAAGRAECRHELMSLGHDPLKPPPES
jgi:hypothetical protein